MAKVLIKHGEVIIEVEWVDDTCALRWQMEIPLVHLTRVELATSLPSFSPPASGRSTPLESGVPQVLDDGRIVWDVKNPAKAIVFKLTGHDYPELVVEVPDPDDVADRVNAAVHQARITQKGN